MFGLDEGIRNWSREKEKSQGCSPCITRKATPEEMAGFAAARARKEKFKGLFGEDKAPIDLCTDPLQEARQKAKERALQKKKELERWRQELDEKHKQKIEILWPQKGDIYYFVELDKNLEPVIKSGRFKDPTEYKEGSNCFMTKEKANSYAREIIDMSEGDV